MAKVLVTHWAKGARVLQAGPSSIPHWQTCRTWTHARMHARRTRHACACACAQARPAPCAPGPAAGHADAGADFEASDVDTATGFESPWEDEAEIMRLEHAAEASAFERSLADIPLPSHIGL